MSATYVIVMVTLRLLKPSDGGHLGGVASKAISRHPDAEKRNEPRKL